MVFQFICLSFSVLITYNIEIVFCNDNVIIITCNSIIMLESPEEKYISNVYCSNSALNQMTLFNLLILSKICNSFSRLEVDIFLNLTNSHG